MRVIQAEVHFTDPLTLALVMRGTRLARALLGDHTVVAHVYLAPPWRWLATECPVPPWVIHEVETAPFARPDPMHTPPRHPAEPPPGLAPLQEEGPRAGGYVLGTVLSAGGLYVAIVLGAGEVAAATVAWMVGAVGYDMGRAIHARLGRP